MARNSFDRLGIDESKKQASAPPQLSKDDSSDFKFTTPTEFVELPTKGKYYPEGHPLYGKESVEIRFMTAKEEDILSSLTLIKNNMVIERLLQSVMVDNVNLDLLFTGDKNALIVATRITGYGPEYKTQVICPMCYTNQTYDFDLSELTLYEGGDYNNFDIEESGEGTFFIDLPMSKVRTEVRLMLGKDEKYLAELAATKKKQNLLESPLTDQFKRIIVSVNGDHNKRSVNQFVDCMPARDSRYLRAAYARVVPDVDMKYEFGCSNCGHQTRLEVPLNAGFLWPGR